MNHTQITDEYLEKMDAYWRATNYLAAPDTTYNQTTARR